MRNTGHAEPEPAPIITPPTRPVAGGCSGKVAAAVLLAGLVVGFLSCCGLGIALDGHRSRPAVIQDPQDAPPAEAAAGSRDEGSRKAPAVKPLVGGTPVGKGAKTVPVSGYTTKNGTYVVPHMRAAPGVRRQASLAAVSAALWRRHPAVPPRPIHNSTYSRLHPRPRLSGGEWKGRK